MLTATPPTCAQSRRIPLTGRLTPEQIAEHNRFIDEMREPEVAPAWTEVPSRFVGCKSGLPNYTTI